jgi:hypothetical protein
MHPLIAPCDGSKGRGVPADGLARLTPLRLVQTIRFFSEPEIDYFRDGHHLDQHLSLTYPPSNGLNYRMLRMS